MISPTMELDTYDLRILAALQENGRLSHIELADRVALSPSQCGRRLRRLEKSGLIHQYTAILDAARVGMEVTAFVIVSLERQSEAAPRTFQSRIAAIPDILECWSVTGDGDYLLRVVAPSLRAFSDFLMDELLSLPNVANVRSIVALDRIKQTTALPLTHAGAQA